MLKTEKLFYKELYQTKCSATIIDISEKGIITDKTIAFPEGGGQQGDTGRLTVEFNGEKVIIPFIDTQKGNGRTINIPDFPAIKVDTPIYHVVDKNDLKYITANSKVEIEINVERRAKLTVGHTGLHVALMAIESVNPDFKKVIKGASISEDKSRLDFLVEDKFSSDYIKEIQEYINNISNSSIDIELFTHPDEDEAWYWKCKDKIYACGGTHLPNTQYLGNMKVKRKGLGKNLERIIVKFDYDKLPLDLYN